MIDPLNELDHPYACVSLTRKCEVAEHLQLRVINPYESAGVTEDTDINILPAKKKKSHPNNQNPTNGPSATITNPVVLPSLPVFVKRKEQQANSHSADR